MTSDEFRAQVKDALEHLHDTAYLQVHPLLAQLVGQAMPGQVTRRARLRDLLQEAIETLRPPEGLPTDAPEWRSYLALRYRYVQGTSMAQVESKLGISLRQLQRELHKGVDALAAALWEWRVPETGAEVAASPVPGSVQELVSELGQWQLERRVCQARDLVDNTLGLLKPLLEQRAVKLSVDLPVDLAPILVDAMLAQQALSKALRLLTQDVGGEVALQATSHGKQVDIMLSSPGYGISTSHEEWQMVELLVARQGGSFSIDAGPETGVRATLGLPRASQTRVLVVDDNPAIHQLLDRYLMSHDYEVWHAQSGPAALQMAVGAQPDVITLDVMMPGTDGWRVLRELTQDPATAHIPVVVCSVLKEPELARSLGASAYLKKPVERLELLATLARLESEAGRAPAVLRLPRAGNRASPKSKPAEGDTA